jgi:hypothetical protein
MAASLRHERKEMKFNLSKYAETDVAPSEKALENQRENLEKVTAPYNGLLESVRKNPDDGKVVTTEGALYDARSDENPTETIEAQIDNHKPGKDLPRRTGNDSYDQLPINLLEEAAHQEKIKAFNSATVKDSDTEFWDELLASDDVKAAPSQLHNHPNRFKNLTKDDVLKNEGVKNMVMASLKDADAMLYHIYRVAASESRELTSEEAKLIDGITADKVKIISKISQANG